MKKIKTLSISVIIIAGLISFLPPLDFKQEITTTLRTQILEEAGWALQQPPVTVTADTSQRSAGGKHDFYSEGDYWWPNPVSIDSPYIQKDGLTNPANFTAHRLAMIRFSKIIGALASAYKITGDEKYVQQAIIHLKAWFTDTATLMNPSLLYAQAIKGRFTGRGIGIIDTIQLMEVAQGIISMQYSKSFSKPLLASVKDWFARYLVWLTTHQYGKDEMNAQNNHGTCWVMQVASFAKLTGNKELMKFCSDRYKNLLLPKQMDTAGGFPLEQKRTKPYGYSLFNLDAMTMICQVLSTPTDNLWNFQTRDGKSIKKGITFLYPYIADKSKWPFSKDVMYWDDWPVAQPALVFGAIAYNDPRWFASWKQLDHDPKVEEVIRNLPVRHPLICLNNKFAAMEEKIKYGCDTKDIAHYTSHKIQGNLQINGDLSKPEWLNAVKSNRFVDMVTGEPAFFDTRTAVLWNDDYLYIAFWADEPFVSATQTERDSIVFLDNDLEIFIDGGDCYYELEINALNTIYETFFIWKDAYKKGGRFDVPLFDVHKEKALTFAGDYDRTGSSFWWGRHPRGVRWVFLDYDMPGLETAVQIDGVINDPSHVDKGWTLEIAIPWKSMKWLANERSLPPKNGDQWKIFFGRFQKIMSAGQEVFPHPAWVVSKHGVYDTHVPECFPVVEFTNNL